MTSTHTHLATALPALRSPLSRRGFLCGLVTAAGAATLAACSSSADRKAGGPVEYWLWDSAQEPAYEACAARFEEKTGIKVNITQVGWGDYWTKLTAGFIAGTGPDVFTDHIAKFAQFVDLDVLVPLDEQPAWADVDESAFGRVVRQQVERSMKASSTCGRARTASSTAVPRTGTPRPSSTTRPCSPRPV